MTKTADCLSQESQPAKSLSLSRQVLLIGGFSALILACLVPQSFSLPQKYRLGEKELGDFAPPPDLDLFSIGIMGCFEDVSPDRDCNDHTDKPIVGLSATVTNTKTGDELTLITDESGIGEITVPFANAVNITDNGDTTTSKYYLRMRMPPARITFTSTDGTEIEACAYNHFEVGTNIQNFTTVYSRAQCLEGHTLANNTLPSITGEPVQ